MSGKILSSDISMISSDGIIPIKKEDENSSKSKQGYGYAGIGAFCSDENYVDNSYGNYTQVSDEIENEKFYGNSGGGGRIQIDFEKVELTRTDVSVNAIASGTGGYIFFHTNQFINIANASIAAIGGLYPKKSDMYGSAGRIVWLLRHPKIGVLLVVVQVVLRLFVSLFPVLAWLEEQLYSTELRHEADFLAAVFAC